ncbi:MAG: pyridine nucleotide-disulfide oxidoreductase family protein [Rhodospirillales bacterium]|nr:pyridine nucleotide-disulfide oxidoreductase family protein [Rhodospirillales bacterium]
MDLEKFTDRAKGSGAPPGEIVPTIRLYGTRECAEAYAIRDFLHRSDVPFEWVELKTDEEARREAMVAGLDDDRLPVCVFSDGVRLERPTVRQITEKLGWFRNPSRTEYDLAIYGAGPAGLSAAVYGASEGLATVLIERSAVGGQASASPKIENYLGFPKGISGAELAERAREQAEHFGAEILLNREGVRGEFPPGKGIGHLADGTKIVARASVIATGVAYRTLGLPEEERFRGAGLYYGVGASEALSCSNDRVVIVGGGNSAGQGALHFARYGAHVTMVVREATLKNTMSEYLIGRIVATPQIEVLLRTEIAALYGDRALRAVTLRNVQSGEQQDLETGWLFVCIGGVPHTEWAADVGMARDEGGYLVTGLDLLRNGHRPLCWTLDRDPYNLETNIPGVFAAGDVRHGSIKRCASAVGEGAMAIASVHRYLMGIS